MKIEIAPNTIRMILAPICIIMSCLALPIQSSAQDNSVDFVHSLSWSPDSTRLAIGTDKGVLYIEDAATGNQLHRLVGHTDQITDVAWSTDGSKLATSSSDKTVRVWDGATGKALLTLTGYNSAVIGVTWNKDGSKIIASGTEDPLNVRIWDASTGKLLANDYIGSMVSMVWSPDYAKLAFTMLGSAVEIWDGAALYPIDVIGYDAIGGEGYDVYSAAWGLDGKTIATGSLNGRVSIWDVATRKALVAFWANNDNGSQFEGVTNMLFSPDGTKLFTVSGGMLRSWDAANGQMLEAKPLINSTTAVAWSPFGTRFAQVGNPAGNTAQTSKPYPLDISVPSPSLSDAQALTTRCAKSDIQPQLAAKLNIKQLPAFVTQVKQLTKDQMPPACAADIVAVANALQSTP